MRQGRLRVYTSSLKHLTKNKNLDILTPILQKLYPEPLPLQCVVPYLYINLTEPSYMCWQGLLPYYRMLLPILNLLKDQNLNLGDMIDYSQVREFSTINLAHIRQSSPDARLGLSHFQAKVCETF